MYFKECEKCQNTIEMHRTMDLLQITQNKLNKAYKEIETIKKEQTWIFNMITYLKSHKFVIMRESLIVGITALIVSIIYSLS